MSTVSVEEIKQHANVTIDDDDALLQTYIETAEAWVKRFTGKSLDTEATSDIYDNFGDLRLHRSPVQSITSVVYLDANGIQQTLNADLYSAAPLNAPVSAAVFAKPGKCFPATYPVSGSVVVNYQAGYGDADDVPPELKHAVKLLAAHFYANREATLVGNTLTITDLSPGVYELLAPFREYVF